MAICIFALLTVNPITELSLEKCVKSFPFAISILIVFIWILLLEFRIVCSVRKCVGPIFQKARQPNYNQNESWWMIPTWNQISARWEMVVLHCGTTDGADGFIFFPSEVKTHTKCAKWKQHQLRFCVNVSKWNRLVVVFQDTHTHTHAAIQTRTSVSFGTKCWQVHAVRVYGVCVAVCVGDYLNGSCLTVYVYVWLSLSFQWQNIACFLFHCDVKHCIANTTTQSHSPLSTDRYHNNNIQIHTTRKMYTSWK